MKPSKIIVLSILFIMVNLVHGECQSKKNKGYHPAPNSPKAKEDASKKDDETKKVDESKDVDESQEDEGPKEKKALPLGWGANIGNISFQGSTFAFGIAPNIAYKFNESLATGFMMKLDYYYAKYAAQGVNYSSFDLGPTVFARYKIFWETEGATPFMKGLFVQAEYERAFIAREETDQFGNIILNGNHIETVRTGEDYIYIGAGTSSGYPFSTFVSIHYNIIDKPELTRDPFGLRLGFTYNY